jgi:hypothetical protein
MLDPWNELKRTITLPAKDRKFMEDMIELERRAQEAQDRADVRKAQLLLPAGAS